MDTYPAILYQCNEERGDLFAVRTLVPATDGTCTILYDDMNHRVWAALYPQLKPDRVVVVDFDKPMEEKVFKIDYASEYIPVESGLFDRTGALHVGLYLVTADIQKQILKQVDIRSGKVSDGDWSDYRSLYTQGPVGGSQPAIDNVVELFPYEDGNLVFRKGDRAIESGLRLRDPFRYKKDDMVWAMVHTPRVVVLVGNYVKVPGPLNLGTHVCRIGRFVDGHWLWHDWIAAGGNSITRLWGNWLAKTVSVSQLEWRVRKPSPGIAERRTKAAATGRPFEWDSSTSYCPGTLLIYNVETRKQYKIETGQGDSEVLLIEGVNIYYRSNDKIFRGRIGVNSITDVDLLVKNAAVPDIHWAFRGKANAAARG